MARGEEWKAERKAEAVPVRTLEDPKVREWVKDAAVVLGLDTSRDELVLFYGRETLEMINRTGVADSLPVAVLSYDQRTDELEFLIAAVRVLKGSDCYDGGEVGPK